MSELSAIFDTLGQEVMPEIASIAFPDTMTVRGKSLASDSGGGQVKTDSIVYEYVPCSYEPTSVDRQRRTSGDALTSIQQYLVTMPTHDHLKFRYDVDPATHRFVVDARGTEPEKTFRILSLRDISGVVFEWVCEREN